MFNKTIKTIFQLFITSLIGAGIFILILQKVGLEQILNAIKSFSILNGLVVLFLFLLDYSILTWRWGMVLKSQGYNISFGKLFSARLVGFAVNYVTPILYTGGEPARAYVLKKEANVPFVTGLISIIVDEFLEVICGSIFLMIGISFLLSYFSVPSFLLNSLLVVIIALLIFWLYFYRKLKTEKGFFTSIMSFLRLDKINFINKHKGGVIKLENELISFIKYKKSAFLDTILITICSYIIGIMEVKAVTVFLGLNLSWQYIIIIKILTILAGVIPIPGALGTLEAADALAFMILGLSTTLGITFALIIRFFNLILVGSGLFLLSHFGVKLGSIFLSKNLNNNDS